MSEKKIEATDAIRVSASSGGRPLTLDPVSVVEVPLRIREVESTIPCGFQQDWGTVEVDGEKLEATSGAGWGNQWATISFKGKSYCFSISEIVGEFLSKVDADAPA
jgi:hypothetical protein